MTRWKKWMAVLLCGVLAVALALVMAGAASDGYRVEGIQSVSLAAPTESVNAVTTTEAAALQAAEAFLATATSSVSAPKSASEVAVLTVVDAANAQRRFALLSQGEGYVLQHDNRYRRVTYDDFNTLVNALGSNRVYKYSALPTATLQTGGEAQTLSPAEGTYSYRRLSGKYSRRTPAASEKTLSVKTTENTIPLPVFSRSAESMQIKLSSNGALLWQGGYEKAKTARFPQSGLYEVEVQVGADTAPYRYNLTYRYSVNYAGEIAFSVAGNDTHLGEVVVLRVTGTTADDPLATYTSDISFSIPPKFHRQADGSQVALFPVSYLNAAGEHWVEVACGGRSARYAINAKDKTWQRQDLGVSTSTAEQTILSQQANAEYERVIAPLRPVADSTRHWSGRFILPVSDNKVTTQFGMVRYVNGSPTSSRHGALDLAVPLGTEVKATGAGRVLYAGFLQLTGNTVLIEHGYGLKSWYYHMDTLAVQTGDHVQQAAKIGTVGSTGFSTGPHLHFGMSVHNVFINPYTAIQTDLLSGG